MISFCLCLGNSLEDINAVFEECSTYQPNLPSSEATIVVLLIHFLKYTFDNLTI